MSDELVTIAKFETAFEAEIAKNTLESNGIQTVVVGQNLTILPVPMPTIAAIEVKVFEADAGNAKAVLDAIESKNGNITDDNNDFREDA